MYSSSIYTYNIISPQTVDGMPCTMCERGKKVHIQSRSTPPSHASRDSAGGFCSSCRTSQHCLRSCLQPQGNTATTTLFLQLRKHVKLLEEVGRLGSVPLEPISGALMVLKGGRFGGWEGRGLERLALAFLHTAALWHRASKSRRLR